MKEPTVSDQLAHAAKFLGALASICTNIEQLDMFGIAQERKRYARAELQATITALAEVSHQLESPPPPTLALTVTEKTEKQKTQRRN